MDTYSQYHNFLPGIVECLVVNHLELQLNYIPPELTLNDVYFSLAKNGYDTVYSLPVYRYVHNLVRFSEYWSINFIDIVGDERMRLDRKLESDTNCVSNLIGYHKALSINPALVFMTSGMVSPTCLVDLASDAIIVSIARSAFISR